MEPGSRRGRLFRPTRQAAGHVAGGGGAGGAGRATRAVAVLAASAIGLAVAGAAATGAVLLSGCGPRERVLEPSVEPALASRFEALLAGHPLPLSWRPATDDLRGKADCGLRLEWRPAGTAPRKGEKTAILDRRWLAAAVDFDDPRLDVSVEEAGKTGLVDMAGIELPRRALSVGGRLPGEKGYAFAEELVLALEPSGGRLPPALSRWLEGIPQVAAQGGPQSGQQGMAPNGPPAPLVVCAVGDMELGPDEAALLLDSAAGQDRLFGRTRPFLEAADILVGNLEGPVTTRTEGNPRKRFQFRFPPGTMAALGRAGFDLLLFANNHGLDFGEGGFMDSLADARSAGMPLVGAGKDGISAAKPESLSRGTGGTGAASGSATRFTFIGFAFYPTERLGFSLDESRAGPGRPGINADEAATLAAIRESAARGDFVTVLAHGGNEYRFDPSPEARRLYRAFIDAGASLVLGSHPHVLQGAEAYHGGLIAYSLGNFLFTGEKEPEEALESAMFRVLVYQGRIRGFGLVPVKVAIDGTELSRAPGLTMADFMARSAGLSR